MTEIYTAVFTAYTIICIAYTIATVYYNGNPYLSFDNNYECWENLNWFGVLFFTILLNIIFAPVAIIYWVSKFFIYIFTVGRNN